MKHGNMLILYSNIPITKTSLDIISSLRIGAECAVGIPLTKAQAQLETDSLFTGISFKNSFYQS